MMQTARNKIQIFIIFNLLFLVSSFWLRYKPLETEEEDADDGFLTMIEESISEISVFNSRGPRALYRGLEEDSEFSWDSIEDYDEDFDDQENYYNF